MPNASSLPDHFQSLAHRRRRRRHRRRHLRPFAVPTAVARSVGLSAFRSTGRTDGRSGHRRRRRRKARRGRSRRAAAALLPACSVARRSLSQSKIEGVARRSSKKKKIMKRGDERRCVRERHNRCRQESQKRKCIALHPFPFPILRRTHSCHHTSVSRR